MPFIIRSQDVFLESFFHQPVRQFTLYFNCKWLSHFQWWLVCVATWHKLESFEKWEPHWRKYSSNTALQARLLGILLINDWWGQTHSTVGGGPNKVVLGGLRQHAEQAKGRSSMALKITHRALSFLSRLQIRALRSSLDSFGSGVCPECCPMNTLSSSRCFCRGVLS